MDRPWNLEEALTALVAWDPGPVRQYLERCLEDLMITPQDLDCIERHSWWNAEQTDTGQHPLLAVQRLFDAAVQVPSCAALLVLYVRHSVSMAWEQATAHEALVAAIDLTSTAWSSARQHPGAAPEDVLVGDLSLRVLRLMVAEFEVENAGMCESLAGCERLAAGLTTTALAIRAAIEAQPSAGRTTIGRKLHELVSVEADYYRALELTARSARDMATDKQGFEAAREALLHAERDSDPVNASELRSHRQALEGLRRVEDDRWLRIDRGKVVVIHPFGIRHVDGSDLLETVKARASDWILSGIPVAAVVTHLPITDAWDSSESMDRNFSGCVLRLPEIYLERDSCFLTIRPSVWFTTLGNHAVRFEYTLDGALPQDLYELINIGDPEFGNLATLDRPMTCRVSSPTGDPLLWPNLVTLVEGILGSIESLLDPLHSEVALAYSRGTVRSVLQITDCSAYDAQTGDSESLDSVEEMAQLVGFALLSQPIDTGTYAVAQWSLYQEGSPHRVTLPASAPSIVNVTENTAVVASLSQPSWYLDIVSDMCGFAFMLSGLFNAWNQELARFHMHSRDLLTKLRNELESDDANLLLSSAEIEEVRQDLNRRHFAIREFMAGCRATMLFIDSSSLVHSPLLRAVLDQILDGTGYERARAQFVAAGEGYVDAQLNRVMEALQQRAASVESEERQRRARQAGLRMEAMLAAVAVAGVSGVASLLQAGYQMDGANSLFLVLVTVGLAIGFGFLTYRLGRNSNR